MPVFYSPTGNCEIWEQKPDGYITQEEWDLARTAEEAAAEAQRAAEEAAAEAELLAEYNKPTFFSRRNPGQSDGDCGRSSSV